MRSLSLPPPSSTERVATVADFLKYYSTIAPQVDALGVQEPQRFSDRLQMLADQCETIRKDVSEARDSFALAVKAQSGVLEDVASSRKALSALFDEKERLQSQALAKRELEAFYAEAQFVTKQLALERGLRVVEPEFWPTMKRLAGAISFALRNPDARAHLSRLQALKRLALGRVKVFLSATFTKAAQQAAQAAAALSEQGESSSAFYVKFRACAPAVRPHLEHLGGDALFSQTLEEVALEFVRSRLKLVGIFGQSEPSSEIHARVEQALEWVKNVYEAEMNLARTFFGGSTQLLAKELGMGLIQTAYTVIVPTLISSSDLKVLVDTINFLREAGKALDEHTQPLVTWLIADAQERAVFCTLNAIRDPKVVGTSRIRFREVLEKASETEKNDLVTPPLAACLGMLDLLAGSVSRDVFRVLAQDIVTRAAQALTRSASFQGSDEEGELFLIRHLALLLEKMGQYDLDLAYTERGLDFSDLKTALRHLLGTNRRVSLFELSRKNPILEVVLSAPPKVTEQRFDVKEQLEQRLATMAENLCVRITSSVCDPLVSRVAREQRTEWEPAVKKVKERIERDLKPTLELVKVFLPHERFGSGLVVEPVLDNVRGIFEQARGLGAEIEVDWSEFE